jgi:hypothetical protein
MGKGSGRRKQDISDKEMEDAWNAIWSGHPSDEQFDKVKRRPNQLDREKALDAALADWGGREHDKFIADLEDDYGNELPSEKSKPKTKDPDRFVDDIGDA